MLKSTKKKRILKLIHYAKTSEDLDLEKNENATKAMEIDRLRRELIELKVNVE
jgi:hypothetical protein